MKLSKHKGALLHIKLVFIVKVSNVHVFAWAYTYYGVKLIDM